MALRIRRRRGAAEQVEEASRGALELASGMAADALAEVTKRPSRARRVGLGLVALALLSALATALYIWWTRRREDEEFARLMQEPDHSWPPASPVPTPPAASPEYGDPAPKATPVSSVDATPVTPGVTSAVADTGERAQPVEAVAQPWAAPAAPSVAPYGTPEGAAEPNPQRPAWNSHRDVPLFVLPPRPNVPFRGAVMPSVDRTHLPGSSSFGR
ncbi:MAG: hypothetical protein IT299_12245 [Dehalococcoidia bacterium]|nr:hypothetical protein [Dehalococcoidia bacterium]